MSEKKVPPSSYGPRDTFTLINYESQMQKKVKRVPAIADERRSMSPRNAKAMLVVPQQHRDTGRQFKPS